MLEQRLSEQFLGVVSNLPKTWELLRHLPSNSSLAAAFHINLWFR